MTFSPMQWTKAHIEWPRKTTFFYFYPFSKPYKKTHFDPQKENYYAGQFATSKDQGIQ